jgi:two-component system chemotaxis sensor kinase CheA
MKGSAGFLELKNIVELTHKAENLLDLFRKEQAQLEGPDIALLLNTLDLLRKVMDDLAVSGRDDTYLEEVESQVAQLLDSINRKCRPEIKLEETKAGAPEAPDEPESEPEPAMPAIRISPEMKARFREEAEELLDAAEQNLLTALDNNAGDTELSEALRSLHSFKGNAGFMGLADLEKLTHRTETILELVVDGQIKADNAALEVFLAVVDVTRRTVSELEEDQDGSIAGLDDFLDSLDTLADGGAETPAAPAPQPQEGAPKSGFIPLGNMKKARPAPAAETAEPAAAEPEAAHPTAAESRPAAPPARAGSTPAAKPAAGVKSSGSIRVDLTKLDTLMNLVGELVIAEAMVTRNPDLDGHEFENLEKASHHLRRITSDLQDVAMSVRMVPLSGTFKKMIRLVHDTGLKAGKKVELELVGEETEVDKTVIEQISDPLVHIVRNAIDHGLETPEQRAQTDKPASGKVTISARHESGEVWITVGDDGKGLDRDVILNKAIERGLLETDGNELRDEDVFKLIFEPGFSTAAQVTEISGRGVGMDVVRKNIEKINGRVDIKSVKGQGSQFIMRIPLTMAIIEGMLVRVGKSTYNIPLLSIREAFRPEPGQITTTPDGIEVVKLREDMIPVIRMHELYGIQTSCEDLADGTLVIVENEGNSGALFVDEILGQQQTVVKALSDYVGSPHGVSGCTILGDGRISLILDVATILNKAATTSVAMA